MLPTIKALIIQLSRLPGIGERTATRLAYTLLKWKKDDVANLANSLLSLQENIRTCRICNAYSEEEICPICSSKERNHELLCIVETPHIVDLIEGAGNYNGIYHVLGGSISPIEGIRAEDLNMNLLEQRIIREGISEVIIATNLSIKGETTAKYLFSMLKNRNVKITRLARGLPVGSDLEYFDGQTIAFALEKRNEIK